MADFTKDSAAVLDYSVNWSAWLNGDTISESTWLAPGLTIDSESETTTATTVWLSGGSAGTTYKITNNIVTDGGRTDERSLTIDVVNK